MLGAGECFGASALIFDTPRYYTVVAKGPVQCWAISALEFHRLHLADHALHLKRAFQAHASVEKNDTQSMGAEDFLRFSHAKEAFPPDKYERLCSFLLALVTLNRLGRAADPKQAAPGDAAQSHIQFSDFVRCAPPPPPPARPPQRRGPGRIRLRMPLPQPPACLFPPCTLPAPTPSGA